MKILITKATEAYITDITGTKVSRFEKKNINGSKPLKVVLECICDVKAVIKIKHHVKNIFIDFHQTANHSKTVETLRSELQSQTMLTFVSVNRVHL